MVADTDVARGGEDRPRNDRAVRGDHEGKAASRAGLPLVPWHPQPREELMDRSASRPPPGAATISTPPPTARSSRSCRTGSIAPSPNRTRRTHPRSGTPTSAGVATTTEQLPDDRVPREARKRRHAKKRCGRKENRGMIHA